MAGKVIAKMLPAVIFILVLSVIFSAAELLANNRQAQAIDILQKAQRAHESGNAGHALALIKNAQRMWPALPEPAWLSRRKAAEVAAQTAPNVRSLGREVLIKRFLNSPNRANITLIERYLDESPEDHELRRLIFDYAVKHGDTELISKHYPFISTTRSQANYFNNLLKYLLLLALAIAIIWQLNALMKDLRFKAREGK